MKSSHGMSAMCLALYALMSGAVLSQVTTNVPPVVAGAKPVTVQNIKVHASSLEGEDVDRDVIFVLPPSYATSPHRRYPVIYALHGYSIGAEQWTPEIHVPQTVEDAFAKGAKEMILILPDSKTVHNGSMYSRSVTTGDFESFIAGDLVRAIDSRYRTIANRLSRGFAGLPFNLRTVLASAAAVQPDVLAKWAANAPLAFIDQYVGNRRQYRAIAIDVGDQGGLRIDARRLRDVLDSYGIANGFEVYPGTHVSGVVLRFENQVIPFFSKNLKFE